MFIHNGARASQTIEPINISIFASSRLRERLNTKNDGKSVNANPIKENIIINSFI